MPIRRLKLHGPLGAAAEAAIRDLSHSRRTVPRGDAVVSPADGVHFLLDGWACRARTLETGRRQIFDIILPGDCVGHLPDDLERGGYEVQALTSVTVVDAASVVHPVKGKARFPDLSAAIGGVKADQRLRLLDHIVRLGSRTAQEGLAHLLLELHARQVEVGLAEGHRFSLPIGQERLGEMLGLSAIHVNRTLGALRKAGHITTGPGWVTLHRPAELSASVGFRRPPPAADLAPPS